MDTTSSIILVEPQLGENIGAAARVMANFGLEDLRIVNPRDGWPNLKAEEMAAHGAYVIETARIYDGLEAALSDKHHAFAITARMRDMEKPVYEPQQLSGNDAMNTALVFGAERSGLTNDQVALCDAILTIPVNPACPSLNLAQAVGVVCYAWFQSSYNEQIEESVNPDVKALAQDERQLAPKAELFNWFERLETALDESAFYRVEEKRDHMVRQVRNIFHKAQLTEQEIRILHGILNALKKRQSN